MIFVTIGTQAPFDRLIKEMDRIAGIISEPIIAQTFQGMYEVKNMKTYSFIHPDEFEDIFNEARLVVSHAGIGSIMTALVKAKPIIIIPRKASIGEHRNEHQIATANKFEELGFVHVAHEISELEELIVNSKVTSLHNVGEFASPGLIDNLQKFINS